MKKILFLFLLVSIVAKANVYYVATDGNDANTGTELSAPFKTITKACSKAVTAGDRIYVRAGTYACSSTIKLTKSGTATAPIYLEGYATERPFIDFSGTAFGSCGFSVTGSYWYIKGLDIGKAGDNGMHITGAFNVIEWCSFYENKDSGLQLSGGAHDNKMLNCDSYWNADPTDYGDADGFACKMDVGTNNYFYGCRSWANVDDGWDGYLRGANNVTTILENCWTWRNGYAKDGTDYGAQANGNGFKMGGSDDKTLEHNFILRNCVAFDNKAKGFDQNNNRGTMIIYNGTSFRNKGNNFSIYLALDMGKTCNIVNCVNYGGNVNLQSFVNQQTNSWLSPFSVTEDDFVSLDTTGVSGPRGADGSLPVLPFLHLKASSNLIDAGTAVGITFSGSAPDLGAFEYNNTSALLSTPFEDQRPYFCGENLIIPCSRQEKLT